jgi:hypothetical protein
MARVLKNKRLSRTGDHAVRQSGVCVTEVYSDVSTNRVPVCYINHTCILTVSNYYIGQTDNLAKSPTDCM